MKKFIFLISVFCVMNVFAKEQISVYTYHNFAPFITDKNTGLSYKLINYLNKNLNDYNFKLKVVPRNRLNYVLKPWINKDCKNTQKATKKCDKNWLVLWVNHKWGFGSDSLENFLWTPLLKDSNAIVSLKSSKVEYTKPEDLIGKKLAGVLGHKYIGIDDLVKAGKIERIDGRSELENLNVVLSKRVNATLLPSSSFKYYKSINKDYNQLYQSKTPHQEYMRNIMTNRHNQKLVKELKALSFDELF